MSVITDMILLTNEPEMSQPVRALQAWCRENADGQEFRELSTEAAGGAKIFTRHVFACAGNYFPWRELIAALPTFGWNSYSADVSSRRSSSRARLPSNTATRSADGAGARRRA